MPPHARPYQNVLETIGWTPLIKLNRVTAGIRTPVYAKAEFFNPGGSKGGWAESGSRAAESPLE